MSTFYVFFVCFLYVCSCAVELSSSDIAGTRGERLRYEIEESHTCLENQFHCKDEAKCIENIRLCDGRLDCSDGSDEVGCFKCKYDFPNGRLIRADQVCDGVADCWHGEDEHACKSPCGNNQFTCNEDDIDTVCIPDEWKCDLKADCPDLNDEVVELCGERNCGVDQFVCRHRLFCIPATWRCDGEHDCGDHSDEDDCDEDDIDHFHMKMTNVSRFAWRKWSQWSSCDSGCDGERTRSRKCRFGDCVGRRNDVEPCGNIYPCVTEPTKGCGTRIFQRSHARLVGGNDAQLHEWPWQVQIFRPRKGIPFCAGSLIRPTWVLTVAHCFYGKKFRANEYSVAVGRQHTSRWVDDDDEQYVYVRSVIMHEEYEKASHRNDIALLRLQHKVTVNHGANVVCLPSVEPDWLQENLREGLECFVTGFGLNRMGRRPATMQEAKVNLIRRKICKKPYVYGKRISVSMLCAGHLLGGVDACQGDSGGPLVCQHPGDRRWYQVGITSWGKGCGLPNKPGVYTNVSSFRRWINKNILVTMDEE